MRLWSSKKNLRIKMNRKTVQSGIYLSRLIPFILTTVVLLNLSIAHADNGVSIAMPNGYLTIKVNDLELESLGGKLRWQRKWDGHIWRFNPQWESLSQTWENATCSQTPVANGAWQWINVDSAGTSTIGLLTPSSAPNRLVANSLATNLTSLPFNQVMSDATNDYPLLTAVDSNIADGCLGSGSGNNLVGIRRQHELYVGQSGHFVFNNSTVLSLQSVKGLPPIAADPLDTKLASGHIDITPTAIAKGFRWQHKNGNWIEYNLRGQVVAYGDPNNNITWLARDDNGLLRGVLDANGRVLIVLHYTGELLTSVSDFTVAGNNQDLPSRTVSYQYDSSKRLVQVTDVRGNTTRYDYVAQNQAISILAKNQISMVTDPEGHKEQFAYTGNSLSQRLAADGGVTDYAFDYDDANQQYSAKISDPATPSGRRVEDSSYDNSGKLIKKIVNGRTDDEVVYDTVARTETHTNARGFKTVMSRNEFEQVTRIDYPDGTHKQFSYSAQNQRLTEEIDEGEIRTQYEYDSNGNLLKKTEAVGTTDQRVTVYQINSLGQTTQMTREGRTEVNGIITPDATWSLEYNALGQISKTTNPEGGVTLFTFNRAGDLISMTDPLNHTTNYEVDAVGNVTKVTDAEGRSQIFSYDKVGNPVGFTDARGKTAKAAYDTMNRLLQTTNPVGGAAKLQYNSAGQPTSVTNEDGRSMQLEFDNFQRITSLSDAVGNKTQLDYNIEDGTATKLLGSLSTPTKIKYPTFTQNNRLDQRERVTSGAILNPNHNGTDNITSGTSYDAHGWVKSEQDANGKLSYYNYNAFGQITVYTDKLGNKTTSEYDARGNLLQLTDANGNTHKFGYDRNDRLIKETLPLGQVTEYSYDAADNQTQRIDPNGNRSVYTYDSTNWLTEIKYYSSDAQLVRSTTLTWDAAHNLNAWTDTDNTRPSGQQTTSGTASYDDANRKTKETISYPNPQGQDYTLSYSYQYTLAGKKKQLTWADGTTIDYGYSDHDELKSVTIPGEGIISVSQFQWTAPSAITLPGGTVQEKSYDGMLNLEELKVKNSQQQPLLELANSYSKRLEQTSRTRTDTPNSSSTTRISDFSYDDESRLVTSSIDVQGTLLGSDSETFTLDAVGNRTAHNKVLGDWTYDANNRLIEKGMLLDKVNYEYDASGNLTRKTKGSAVTEYSYDTQNRLVQVSDGSGDLIARYGYDMFDRRIWKEQYRTKSGVALAQAKRSYYLYSDEGLIAESRQDVILGSVNSVSASVAPVIVSQYGPRPDSLFGTGVLFVKTKNSNGADTVAYYQHDHLNTPIQATDRSGNVVWSAQYNAFGRATITTPAATAEKPTIVSDLRLPGQLEDAETGLHYNWHRYYEPEVGRYVTSDSIGLAGGVNLYAYVYGNPINLFDPYGYWAWGDPLPQGLVDGAAGFGDSMSSGLTLGFYSTADLRKSWGIDGGVDKCSQSYGAGGLASDVLSLLGGGALVRQAFVKMPGRVRSHGIPDRFIREFQPKGKPNPDYKPWLDNKLGRWFVNSEFNLSSVTPYVHRMIDPKAQIKGMTKAIPRWVAPRRMLNRLPPWIPGFIFMASPLFDSESCKCEGS